MKYFDQIRIHLYTIDVKVDVLLLCIAIVPLKSLALKSILCVTSYLNEFLFLTGNKKKKQLRAWVSDVMEV